MVIGKSIQTDSPTDRPTDGWMDGRTCHPSLNLLVKSRNRPLVVARVALFTCHEFNFFNSSK